MSAIPNRMPTRDLSLVVSCELGDPPRLTLLVDNRYVYQGPSTDAGVAVACDALAGQLKKLVAELLDA